MIGTVVLVALWTAGACGCLSMIIAAALMVRPARPALAVRTAAPAVTILKPLHGDEVGLFENLASVCEQEYAGAVQIVFGVANPNGQTPPTG